MSKKQLGALKAMAAVVASCGLVSACGCDERASGEQRSLAGPSRVLATIGMIGDVAARIGGTHVHVQSLMGPGVDPHLYKASEADVRRLEDAGLILYNGLHLEGKMGEILVKLSRSRPVLAVSESIPRDRLREPPEFKGHYDPHVWFDVGMWAMTIDPIARELSRLDPPHAPDFQANAEKLRQDLAELDAWVETRIAQIPAAHRVLVTAHDAFGYFGRRYGLEVVGLQGVSTAAEASIPDVDRVVNAIVSRKLKAIFVESSVPRRTVEAVVKACEAKGHRVVIGGELFSDALGPAGTPACTYRGMVEHNVNTIVEALR